MIYLPTFGGFLWKMVGKICHFYHGSVMGMIQNSPDPKAPKARKVDRRAKVRCLEAVLDI